MTECSAEGCDRAHTALGMCTVHYHRWRKSNPLLAGKKKPAVEGCSIEGCDRRGRITRGWCQLHYGRWRRNGDPLLAAKPKPKPPPGCCSVQGCDKPVRTYGYCYAHYMKWWRYGTATPVRLPRVKKDLSGRLGARPFRAHHDVTGQRFGSLVVLEYVKVGRWSCRCDCGAATIVRTGDLNRGTTTTCGDWRVHPRWSRPSYQLMHRRVKLDRGRAGDQVCVDCGARARDWSYDHADPDERIEDTPGAKGFGCTYSLKVEHYQPRCVRCHHRFDGTPFAKQDDLPA